MHLCVAVHATPTLGDRGPIPPARVSDRPGCSRRLYRAVWGVTGLAQERWPALQHASRRRAVGVMADGAILVHRLVAVHEGSALFHVAGVAGFRDAIALHQAGACGAVYVMAIRACHLAFGNRVVRGLGALCALLFVAGKTGFTLAAFVTNSIFGNMHLVASGASDITCLVGTAFPVRALGVLGMAVLAGAVAGIGSCSGFDTESNFRLGRLFGAFVPQMFLAGAVAAGAGRCAAIGLCAVAGFPDGEEIGTIRFVVALGTCRVTLEKQIGGGHRRRRKRKSTQGCTQDQELSQDFHFLFS